MVQKSILSFFSATKGKKADPEDGEAAAGGRSEEQAESPKKSSSQDGDSPIKRTSKGRALVVESDSEDEAEPTTSSSLNKVEEETENKKYIPNLKSDKEDTQKEKLMVNDSDKKSPKASKGSVTKKTPAANNCKSVKKSPKIKTVMKDNPVKEAKDGCTQKMSEGDAGNADNKDSSVAGPSSSTLVTPKKRESNSSASDLGFTPETVPPIRKTARKQMKRKSDSMESKQMELIKNKKKKIEDGSFEDVNENSKPEEKEEPMEVGSIEKASVTKKESDAKMPIHSFFAPRTTKKSPVKPKVEESMDSTLEQKSSPAKKPMDKEKSEEETCTSPIKRQRKVDSKKKKNVIVSDSEEEEEQDDKCQETQSKEQVASSQKKDDLEDVKDDASYKDSKKLKSTSKEEKDVSPKKVSAKESPKPGKKQMINPFAPKSAGAGDPGMSYNPTKANYHPIKDAFWDHSTKVPYLAMAKTFEHIEKTSGRLKTIEILSNFLRSVIVLSPDDFLYCIYLCLNKVAPAFEGIELNVGDMILMKSIAQASGRSVDKIKNDAEEQGDLGIVAEQSRSNQRLMFQPAKLTVSSVFERLKEIALMTGNAVQSKKIDKIKGMFVACRFSEARFLIRSLSGKLRIGLAEQSVLQAIAQACYLTPPCQNYPPEILNAGKGLSPDKLKSQMDNYGLILKTTYCEFPSYDKIISVLLKEGLETLPKHCKLTPGVPLMPMLAHPTSGVSEVLRRFENAKFTCEFKYDGERAQIHLKDDGTINIYSRNQENNTTKYPDIIARFKNAVGENVKSCVIDSEAVAWDPEKKQILPFQILSTRKRKDVNKEDIKVQVCVFPFDLLYLNGEALVREPFEKRRSLLRENFSEVEGEFVFARSMDSTNTEDIEEFLEESIKGNCEGLMVKTLDVDATYEISKRSRNWLKLKKDYLDGVGDTVDAVVIGGYYGKGKRKGFYGCFLLACYDPDNEEFQSLCKIGTGFTEEQLQTHTAFLKEHVIEKPKSYYRYDSSHEPDVWFEAVQVWEVKCADLSISPHHKAASGVVDPEKGISLRFPRFLRIRDDKTPETATSASQISELYNNQAQIQNKNASGKVDEEDYY